MKCQPSTQRQQLRLARPPSHCCFLLLSAYWVLHRSSWQPVHFPPVARRRPLPTRCRSRRLALLRVAAPSPADQAEDLPEWVEYHLGLGASHIYVFDTGSRPPVKGVLRPYLRVRWQPGGGPPTSTLTVLSSGAGPAGTMRDAAKGCWCGGGGPGARRSAVSAANQARSASVLVLCAGFRPVM